MRARHKFMENFNFQGGTRTKILFPSQIGTIWPSHKEKAHIRIKRPPCREKENLICFPGRDERLLLPTTPPPARPCICCCCCTNNARGILSPNTPHSVNEIVIF